MDVEREELRRNNLRCPTRGFDLSDAQDLEDVDQDEESEADDEEEEEEDEDDDEEE